MPLTPSVIRRIQAGDAEALMEFYNGLSRKSLRTFRPLGPKADLARCRDVVQGNEPDRETRYDLVALSGPRIVGWCFVWDLDTCKPSFGLGIADNWQRQGLGATLMDRVMAVADGRGLAPLFLTVVKDNAVARRMYTQRRFVPYGEYVDQADGETYLQMLRTELGQVPGPTPSPLRKVEEPSSPVTTPPVGWEEVIRGFEEFDRANPPPPNPLLLTGSSSIGFWPDPKRDFAPLPVVQRGFGGSCMFELLHYVPRIVLPYHPSQVVIYSGDNDIAAGRTPAQIANDFAAIVSRIRAALPATRVFLLSIKPSPSRANLWEGMRGANRLLRDGCAATGVVFVDIWEDMLNPDGTGRTDLYTQDLLHMNAEGYALWAGRLRPLVFAKRCRC